MKSNELLFWLSARREGSWHQFRAVVDELNAVEPESTRSEDPNGRDTEFPLHLQLRRNFLCAAHVEFFENDSKYYWRVAPPILAVHPTVSGFRAVLCGARSPALRERALQVGPNCVCEVIAREGVPDVIRYAARSHDALSGFASHARLHFQPNAPLSILALLPPCDPPAHGSKQSSFPTGSGWRIREFESVALRWRASNRQDAEVRQNGLFEFSLYDDWRYFLIGAGRSFQLPRAIALYAFLSRHQGSIRYDEQTQMLTFPGICRPPPMLERALVLCSGFPPTFDPLTSRLNYVDVPPNIAHLALELLRQVPI